MARPFAVSAEEREVTVDTGRARLGATLGLPRDARGVVMFAHGSGSSRHSERNRFVAEQLRGAGFGTLLLDLLTLDEDRVDRYTREYRFDIPRLAERLVGAADWLGEQAELRALPIGLFGASTGSGAALNAATQRPREVRAVVSRGGRPDLAGSALRSVRAPTLLIVGGNDEPVIELNREAMARMPGVVRLEIVPGATHLFEEPGTLEEVARLARDWFDHHLVRGA